MKRFKAKVAPSAMFIVLLFIGIGVGYTARDFYQPPKADALVSVCFTPGKHCQLKIIQAINNATQSILVQAYSFTDQEISNALVKAAKRGVSVKVILDKSNRTDNRSVKNILIQNNIPLRFDALSGISHSKILILDYTKVISGSYNFSQSAYKRNTENLLFIQDPNLAQEYVKNWLKRWEVSFSISAPYTRPTKKRVLRKNH